MKKVYLVIFTGIFLCCLNGCSIFPEPENVVVNYYDIGFPKNQMNPGIGITVKSFDGGMGKETRMVFRDNLNKIQFDAFNRWCFPPSKLIQRYITVGFNDNQINKIKYYINGDVFRFDGDLKSKTANISLKVDIYSIKNNDLISSETYNVSIPVEKRTATDYSQGLEKGMSQIIQKIALQIKNIKGK